MGFSSQQLDNEEHDAALKAKRVTLASGLSESFDSVLVYPRGINSITLTSSNVVLGTPGKLVDVFCTSGLNVTVKLWDNASVASGTVLVDTFSIAAGAAPLNFNFRRASKGIFATISGTDSPSLNFGFDPTTT